MQQQAGGERADMSERPLTLPQEGCLRRPTLPGDDIRQCYRSEGPFSLIVAHLLEDEKYLDYCCHCFFMEQRQTNKKTQSPCCLYDLETPAQDKSLYNLLLYAWLESGCMRRLLVETETGGFREAFVLGEVCDGAVGLVGVGVRGHGGSRDALVSASTCPRWEKKTKKQRRLICVLQSFLVGCV